MNTNSQPQKFTGQLDWFFETGCEGLMWSFTKDGYEGWASLHILHNGDYLTVFNEDGSVLWQGTIDLECDTGRQPPPRAQQAVFGMWVHGNQRGFKIEDWAEMFLSSDLDQSKYKSKLRGELIPNPAPQPENSADEE